MKYAETKDYVLHKGTMQEVLKTFEQNSVDSIVTDPPYELNFMGKGWDSSGVAFQKETWEHCFNVLKPGGYLLAFGGSRTYHRICCAIEDAGFEIRDCIMWLYGSGFPKSMNVAKGIEAKLTRGSANKTQFSELNGEKLERGNWGIAKNSKEYGFRDKDYTTETDKTNRLGKLEATTDLAKHWDGWGTCLKPAYEPIIVARKPFKGSLVDNVIENGVGGLNIDECRVGNEERIYKGMSKNKPEGAGCFRDDNWIPKDIEVSVNGRFPANVILTYDETDFDEVCDGFPSSNKPNGSLIKKYECNNEIYGAMPPRNEFESYQDTGSASRYFYCAKASKKDRDEGLETFETKKTGELQGGRKEGSAGSIMKNANGGTRVNPYAGTGTPKKNIHPTVKPVELMQYLVRLVTPKGGTVLDCFMGSGSTGKAVMFENRERDANYKFIGIDLTEEYMPICEARIEYALNKYKYEIEKENKEEQENGFMNIFDFIEEE